MLLSTRACAPSCCWSNTGEGRNTHLCQLSSMLSASAQLCLPRLPRHWSVLYLVHLPARVEGVAFVNSVLC